MFPLLYILKYFQKTIVQLYVTEVVLAVSTKIRFHCLYVIHFAIPFPTFTLPFHPEFSLSHIFQPWLCSAIRGMEMEQTQNHTTILWEFNTIYICCQVFRKFYHRNALLKSIDICCCMCFLLSTVCLYVFQLYHPHSHCIILIKKVRFLP